MEVLINYTYKTWRAPSNKTSGSECTHPYPAHFLVFLPCFSSYRVTMAIFLHYITDLSKIGLNAVMINAKQKYTNWKYP